MTKQQRLKPGELCVLEPGENIESCVAITVPIATTPPGYMTRRVDVRGMTAKQSQRLHDIMHGLRAADARLQDGTIVSSPMHAIKWMLEQ